MSVVGDGHGGGHAVVVDGRQGVERGVGQERPGGKVYGGLGRAGTEHREVNSPELRTCAAEEQRENIVV